MTSVIPRLSTKFFLILVLLGIVIVPASANPTGGFQWMGHQDIFFYNQLSSTVQGYYIMDHIPRVASESSRAVTVSLGNPVVLGNWIIPLGSPLNDTAYTIAPGLWQFHIYAISSSSTGIDTIKFNLINRTATGIETDLFYGTAISGDINPTTNELMFEYARRNTTQLNPGDRIVLKATVSTTSVASKTVTVYFDGNLRASRVTSSYWIGTGNNFPPSESAGGEAGNSLAYAVIGGGIGGFTALMYWKRRNKK